MWNRLASLPKRCARLLAKLACLLHLASCLAHLAPDHALLFAFHPSHLAPRPSRLAPRPSCTTPRLALACPRPAILPARTPTSLAHQFFDSLSFGSAFALGIQARGRLELVRGASLGTATLRAHRLLGATQRPPP